MNFTISDLRDRPTFFETVADRIWRQWWEPRGIPLSYIEGRLHENLNPDAIPFALVAHDGDTFLGTASVIASDLDDMPQYTPWVAAVWVDPQYRERHIGRALVARAAHDVFALGIERVYLTAAEPRRTFYERQGWVPIAEGIGPRRMVVFMMDRVAEL